MMNRMIVGNLVYRPIRSLISIVAVALEVTLILLIVGLSLGMLQDTRTRTAGIGADVIVLPPGSSFIAGLKGARKFLPLATLQDLTGAKDKASVMYLKLDDPANADLVVDEIKQVPGMERYVASSMSTYISMMTPTNYPGLSSFIKVVIGISVVIGFIVIFQSMYTAVMERTREIGILKATGAAQLYIVNVKVLENFLLAIGGFIGGRRG